MIYKRYVHHLTLFKTGSIFFIYIIYISNLLVLLQVLNVVYGPLVRERENSMDKRQI